MTWFLLKHVFMFCRLHIGKGKWVYGQTCAKLISACCPHPHFWVFTFFSNCPPIRVCFIGQVVTFFREPFYIGCHTTRHVGNADRSIQICVCACRWWVSLWHHFFAFCWTAHVFAQPLHLFFPQSRLQYYHRHYMLEITVNSHYTARNKTAT